MKNLLIFVLLFACNIKEPVNQADVLSKSSPEAEGISSRAIMDFIEAAEKEQPDALHSMMIVRHGKIVAEGWWDPYNPESPHLLYSLSKSFTSTAIGLAVEEGLISLDDQVISFFPEKVPEDPSENLKAMRIKDLLRMTTGHRTDSYRRIMDHPDGWVAGFLSLPVEHKPGSIFIYNTGATYMLSAILQNVTGQTLTDFLQPRLFDPLEISKPFWQSDPAGINLGGTGLFVRILDIAKLGQLYLQKGSWKGQQILSEDWVEQATSLQTSNGSNPESDWDQGYGYQFWRCRHNLYRGDGAFGQYCIVMPEQDAVVAITSGSNDMQGIMNLVWDHLLPAMGDEPLPEDEETLALLNSRLESLALAPVQGEETQALAKTISGKKYVMEENPQGIKALALNIDQEQKSMTFWTDEGEQSIPVGFNDMPKGEMMMAGVGMVLTASSGAWINKDTYKITTYNYETPHAVNYTFKFKGDKMIIDSEFNVALRNARQTQMNGWIQE
jgi:CubicO group peptidase (beta-lactamase class C family)